jgi:hypothetical protein
MAMVNQMMPLSGHPKRFSFHMETNVKTTRTKARKTINHRLKAIIVSWGCTRSIWSWTAWVNFLSVRLGLVAFYRVLGLVGLPYQLPPAAVL